MQPSGPLSAATLDAARFCSLLSPHLKATTALQSHTLENTRTVTALLPRLSPIPAGQVLWGMETRHVFLSLVGPRSQDDNYISRGEHTVIDAQRD